jgi:hypothetical protein
MWWSGPESRQRMTEVCDIPPPLCCFSLQWVDIPHFRCVFVRPWTQLRTPLVLGLRSHWSPGSIARLHLAAMSRRPSCVWHAPKTRPLAVKLEMLLTLMCHRFDFIVGECHVSAPLPASLSSLQWRRFMSLYAVVHRENRSFLVFPCAAWFPAQATPTVGSRQLTSAAFIRR